MQAVNQAISNAQGIVWRQTTDFVKSWIAKYREIQTPKEKTLYDFLSFSGDILKKNTRFQ